MGIRIFPRVSIGLPVYNGEIYLQLALDSLLKQDFGDFEIQRHRTRGCYHFLCPDQVLV